jgi:hypothetical protein
VLPGQGFSFGSLPWTGLRAVEAATILGSSSCHLRVITSRWRDRTPPAFMDSRMKRHYQSQS